MRLPLFFSLPLCTLLPIVGMGCGKSDSAASSPQQPSPAPNVHGCSAAKGDGLELCYDFENATTSAVPDESGHGRAAAVAGTASFPDSDGRGKVMHLNGDPSESIRVGKNLDLPAAVSVEIWLRADSFGAWSTGISNWSASTGYWLGGSLATGGFEFEIDGAKMASSRVAQPGEWHHAAGTYDPITGDMRLYVDGRLADSRTDVHPAGPILKNEGEMFIGSGGDVFAPWKGDIDDVRVWSRVLDAAEICAHAGGTSAFFGDCAAAGPPVGPAGLPFPEFARLLDRLAGASESGQPVDLDDDGYTEYTREVDPSGAVTVNADMNQDQAVDYHEEFDPQGNGVVWSDADADGFHEIETTVSVGPPRVHVTLQDTNFDGVYDLRLTQTYDKTRGTVATVKEIDPDGDGTFEEDARGTAWQLQRKCTCPCGVSCDIDDPGGAGGSGAGGSAGAGGAGPAQPPPCQQATPDFPPDAKSASEAGDVMVTYRGVVILANEKAGNPKTGSCGPKEYAALTQAFDCATRKLKCLKASNGALNAAVNGGLSKPLQISCANTCGTDSATTGQYWDESKGSRMDLNPGNFMKDGEATRCETILHELIHTGAYKRDVCHDCGKDDVYACARHCAGCLVVSNSALGITQASDCATCMDTAEKKESICGVKVEKVSIPSPGWGMGICHDNFDNYNCLEALGTVKKFCDDTALSTSIDCCQTCPANASLNDYSCESFPPATPSDTCNQKPKDCK